MYILPKELVAPVALPEPADPTTPAPITPMPVPLPVMFEPVLDTPPALRSYGGTGHRCSGKGPTEAPHDKISTISILEMNFGVGRLAFRWSKDLPLSEKITVRFPPNRLSRLRLVHAVLVVPRLGA